MEFGPVPPLQARGAILAHTLRIGERVFRKGMTLSADDCDAIAAQDVAEIVIARPGADDVDENQAARCIAEATGATGLRIGTPGTGRCNLHAESAGLLRIDVAAIDGANAIDEALTIATPPDYARLARGQLAATAKVIPYAASRESLDEVCARLRKGGAALALHPFVLRRMVLLSTRVEGQKASVLARGVDAVRARVDGLGSTLRSADPLPHHEDVLARAIADAVKDEIDALLILAATATSDRRDVAPAAITHAGGEVLRFGMPVDPGNLLVLARCGDVPVIVLPGCARSPALNGADWVLERLAARLPITSKDIARMGVGGLLKEMPGRPHPREAANP